MPIFISANSAVNGERELESQQVENNRGKVFSVNGWSPLFLVEGSARNYVNGVDGDIGAVSQAEAITLNGVPYFHPNKAYWAKMAYKGIYNSLKLPSALTDLDPASWGSASYEAQGDLKRIQYNESVPADIANKNFERVHNHTRIPNAEYEIIKFPSSGNFEWNYYTSGAEMPTRANGGPSQRFYKSHLFRSQSNPQLFVYLYPHGDHETADTNYDVLDANGLNIGHVHYGMVPALIF